MITKPHWVAFAIVAALLCGTASTASAQYYGRPRHYYVSPYGGPAYRSGLVIGGGIGFGTLSADQCGDLCGGALSLEGHIGGMVDPRMALMFDAWTTIHPIPGSDGQTTNTLYTGALQFWPAPIVWLKGGVGLGNTQISSNSVGTITDATAFALLGAAGVEIVQSGWFALDLQARLGHTFYAQAEGGPITNFAFMVGFNWY
jgi:hypothetical protein